VRVLAIPRKYNELCLESQTRICQLPVYLVSFFNYRHVYVKTKAAASSQKVLETPIIGRLQLKDTRVSHHQKETRFIHQVEIGVSRPGETTGRQETTVETDPSHQQNGNRTKRTTLSITIAIRVTIFP
jgi:hypothetical protein